MPIPGMPVLPEERMARAVERIAAALERLATTAETFLDRPEEEEPGPVKRLAVFADDDPPPPKRA